jgi:hypothetical protein
MRSLTNVRSRVDRLASRLDCTARAGCQECRGNENAIQYLVVYGDAVAKIPPETRCAACGRVIPKQYLTISYDERMKPPEQRNELPEESDP